MEYIITEQALNKYCIAYNNVVSVLKKEKLSLVTMIFTITEATTASEIQPVNLITLKL